MRMGWVGVGSVIVVLGACSSSSDPVASMCSRVASGPGCTGTDPKVCESIARQEVANAGPCASALEAMIGCVAETEIYCTGGKARSPGDPGGTESVLYSSNGYSVEIFGKACKEKHRAYMECTECGESPGWAEKKPGVGDPCSGGCATGLRCVAGFCTRTCGDGSGPCTGTHYIDGICAGSGTKKDVFCEDTGFGKICLPECSTTDECARAFPGTDCTDGRCRPPQCGARTPGTTCASSTTFQGCFTCCNTAFGTPARQELVKTLQACACASGDGGASPCASDCGDLCTKSFLSSACTSCVMSETADNAACSCGHDAACAPGTACGDFDACLRSCVGLP